MATIIYPKVTTYGNSFTETASQKLSDHTPPHSEDIDLDSLGKLKQSDIVEFSEFEEQIRDYVLGMLGHPVVRVELTDFQLKSCIDEAITELDYHAPQFTKQVAAFETVGGYNLYSIPPYILRNLTYLTFKKTLLSIQSQAGTIEFDFFIKYFQDNFLFDNFTIGDYYLLQSTMETTRRILGQDGGWDVIDGQFLQVYPVPAVGDVAILEYTGLNAKTITPKMKSWLKKYATACAKVVLGQVRGKFSVVPGPGGGTMLNGGALIQEGMQDKQVLKDELMNEVEEPPKFTTG
jgi:hypothetical protein